MKILLLEDNAGDARLLREALSDISGVTFQITVIETLERALSTLGDDKFDIGLLDLALPDAVGLEVVRRVHHRAPDMPIVVLSALKDERVAVQSLHEGAQDYLVKGEFHGHSVWRALRYAMERQHLQLELRNLSMVDDLTGLSNRKGFLNLANHHVSVANRTAAPFLVGFIDLDNMKAINDAFGHQEGNRALVETAQILRASFRQSDILARFGGDEFAVLVTEAIADSATIVLQRLQEKVQRRNQNGERPYALSMSIGFATSHEVDPPDLERLLHHADAMMYQQKQEKRAAARELPRL